MKKSTILILALFAAAMVSAPAADVKEVWEKNCTKCHGADGKGETKLGKKSEVKDMTDAKWQADLKDDKAFKSVKEGIKEGDKIRMKPAEGVTDEDIKALVAHTRTFKK
jgi:cytochrome c6